MQQILQMKGLMNQCVIEQEEAAKAMINRVRLARAGLHAHNLPLGVLCF